MRFFKSNTFKIFVALVIVFTSFAAFTGSYKQKAVAVCAEHSWCTVTYIQSSTCTRGGVRYCRCTKCGVYQHVNDNPLGHDWKLNTIVQQPSCTRTGVGYYVCARCGVSKYETLPMTAHVYRQRYVCGYNEWYCIHCGKVGFN